MACFEILGIFLHWVCSKTHSDAVQCSLGGSVSKHVLHQLFIDCLKESLNPGIKGKAMHIQEEPKAKIQTCRVDLGVRFYHKAADISARSLLLLSGQMPRGGSWQLRAPRWLKACPCNFWWHLFSQEGDFGRRESKIQPHGGLPAWFVLQHG